MDKLIVRIPSYAVLLTVFAAMFSFFAAVLTTNSLAIPAVPVKQSLPYGLAVFAGLSLLAAFIAHIFVWAVNKRAKLPTGGPSTYRKGVLALGVILVVSVVGSISGFRAATTRIAEIHAEAEAEKVRVAKQKEVEQIALRKVEQDRETERQRVAALTPAQRAAEEKTAQDKAAASAKAEKEKAAAAAKAAADAAKHKAESLAKFNKYATDRIAKEDAEARKYAAATKGFGPPPTPNALDGTYLIVKQFLRDQMNDPDSLKMVSCGPVTYEKAGWIVHCSYRGKNAYGAVVLNRSLFVIRNNVVLLAEAE